MPSKYHAQRPTCGTIDAALSQVADIVGEHLDERGVRGTARDLGLPKSGVHRNGADLDRWSARDLLRLAALTPSVGAAVVALVTGRAPDAAEPTAAVGEAYATARACALLIDQLMGSVADGRFTKAEARAIRARVALLQGMLGELVADVDAAAGVGR